MTRDIVKQTWGRRTCRALAAVGVAAALGMVVREAGAQATVSPMALSKQNSMTGELDKRPALDSIWSWRDIKQNTGFVGCPIGELTVLNRYDPGATGAPDQTLAQEYANRDARKFDLVVNGTFYDSSTSIPSGSILRKGRFHTGVEKTANRGAVAVYKDGTLVVARSRGVSPGDVDARFGSDANPATQFMGGGGLILELGRKISSRDLEIIQKFDQVGGVPCTPGDGGILADQFRSTRHLIIAVREGQAYVLMNEAAMTGSQLQTELRKHGFEFDTAVKFDGGSGAFYKDGRASGVSEANNNPSGFGIKTPEYFVYCHKAKMDIKPQQPADVELEEFLESLSLADVEFAIDKKDPTAVLLHIEEISLDVGQAALLKPGAKIHVPLAGSVKIGEGVFRIDAALLLEVVEVSQDIEALGKKHQKVKELVDHPSYEGYADLLHFDRFEGGKGIGVLKKDSDELTAGPIGKDWPRGMQQRNLEFVKDTSELMEFCFVAGAVYQTDDNQQIRVFRQFRDEVLMESEAGRRLVDAYYRHGPAWAAKVRQRPAVARIIRPCFDQLAVFLSEADWDDPMWRDGLRHTLETAQQGLSVLEEPSSGRIDLRYLDPRY